MGKMCTGCMEEYRNDDIMTTYKSSDVGLFQDCPKRSCRGKVFNIDDNILSTILVLNSKGYPTYRSCAGHHLEEDTECYIEFNSDVKSLPNLPDGFRLRMKKTGDNNRLSIFRKSEAEDPIEQFSEILEIAEALYEWAIDLEFNFKGMEVYFIDLDESPFTSFMGIDWAGGEPEIKEKKKQLDVDKLKETAPKGSIKLKRAVPEESANDQAEPEEDKVPEEDKKNKEEAPKKKRGRPKKNDD